MADKDFITAVESEISQLKACLEHEGISLTGGVWGAIVKRLQDAVDAEDKSGIEIKSRDDLLDAAKLAAELIQHDIDCFIEESSYADHVRKDLKNIQAAITDEESRQAAWIANGKKPSRSLENFSLVTGVPMDQLEKYLGGEEGTKLSAYRAALEAFKRDALCNCESTGKTCLLCFEMSPNEHNLCTSLHNLIAKQEKKEEDK